LANLFTLFCRQLFKEKGDLDCGNESKGGRETAEV
jgi:hypothetical protein